MLMMLLCDNIHHSVNIMLPHPAPRVTFKVGAHEPPVQSFKMIERHYFKDKLLRSFEFDFGFCIPSSTNTVEHVYDLPALNEQDGRWWGRCLSFMPPASS